MASEPKRPIEELLEASAKARRAEFGVEPKMPNPMRARLHDELARIDQADAPQGRRSWLAMFWPQVSLATAVAAVLVVGIAVWRLGDADSPKPTMQLALNEAVPAASPADPAAALRSLDEAAAADLLAKNEKAKASELTAAEAIAKSDNAKLAELAAEAEPAPSADAARAFADGAIAAAPPVASAPAPAAAELRREEPAPAQAPVAGAGAPAAATRSFTQTRQLEQTARQRFTQAPARAGRADAKRAEGAQILNSFDVQQEGERIRVVDEDGSTYTGKLEPVVVATGSKDLAEKKESDAAAKRRAARNVGPESQSNEFKFRAEGYNSSLRKQVVFEGNYIAPAEAEQAKESQAAREQQSQSPARVIGTARVPGEPPIEVDAVSVTR